LNTPTHSRVFHYFTILQGWGVTDYLEGITKNGNCNRYQQKYCNQITDTSENLDDLLRGFVLNSERLFAEKIFTFVPPERV
jgi:hypothetical protein